MYKYIYTHNPPLALYNGVGDGAVAVLSPARAVPPALSLSLSLCIYIDIPWIWVEDGK